MELAGFLLRFQNADRVLNGSRERSVHRLEAFAFQITEARR